MKNILLAVVGKSEAIILEAIYAFEKLHNIHLDEIHCITTGECKHTLAGSIYSPSLDCGIEKFYDNNSIPFSQSCFWAENENGSIDLASQRFTIIKDENGLDVDDILNYHDNEAALKTCLEKAAELSRDDTTVYYLIAGGRKTMAGNLTLAAQWYGREQDRICHILLKPADCLERVGYTALREKNLSDFFQEKQITLHLITFPVLSVREFFPEGQPADTPDIHVLMASLVRDHSYDTLCLDLQTRVVSYHGHDVQFYGDEDLGPAELAQYAFFADHPGEFFFIDESAPEDVRNELAEIYREINPRNTDLFSLENGPARSRIARINKAITKHLVTNDSPIHIKTRGERPYTTYGIDFAGQIQFTSRGRDTTGLRTILLAVTGESPQIITEALYRLAHFDRQVDEVHCITTGKGLAKLEDNNFFDPQQSPIVRLCEENEQVQQVSFARDMVYLPEDESGNPVDDILLRKDNERLLAICLRKAHEFTGDNNTRVYFLIAGGRKTMSSCLTLAAQVYGRSQDRIYHVLVSPPEVEAAVNFWYPTSKRNKIRLQDEEGNHVSWSDRVKVHLVNLPFPLLSKYLADSRPEPEILLQAITRPLDFTVKVFLDDPGNNYIAVVFGESDERQLNLSAKESAIYAYLLYLRKDEHSGEAVCINNQGQLWHCPDAMSSGVNYIYRKFNPDDHDIQLNDFGSSRRRINNKIEELFSVAPAGYHLRIHSRGPRGNKEYFIPLDADRITFYPTDFTLPLA